MDDSAIIKLLKSRDENAIALCADSYGRLLHRIAYNILDKHEDAEECVQDALHKLWESDPAEPIVSLRAYLITLVRNTALQHIREDSAQKRGGGEYEAALCELEYCIPANDDVEAEAEARELAAAVGRWLSRQSADDRALFVRRYHFGDPVSLLAEELGQPPAKVSKRLYNLREKLRRHLVKERFLK